MNTPYWQKATSLAAALVRSPRQGAAWAQHLPVWGRQPIDLELPWWSYGAINYVDGYLRSTHRVFEYGSGGSSLFFARRAASVLAVENESAWQRLLVDAAARRGLANLTCEMHPLREEQTATFPESSFCQRVTSDVWDVVAIDFGSDAFSYGLSRPTALTTALPHIAPGGIIILDDSWLYRELLNPRAGWEIRDYVGLGPCRYGVTSTAIFRRLT